MQSHASSRSVFPAFKQGHSCKLSYSKLPSSRSTFRVRDLSASLSIARLPRNRTQSSIPYRSLKHTPPVKRHRHPESRMWVVNVQEVVVEALASVLVWRPSLRWFPPNVMHVGRNVTPVTPAPTIISTVSYRHPRPPHRWIGSANRRHKRWDGTPSPEAWRKLQFTSRCRDFVSAIRPPNLAHLTPPRILFSFETAMSFITLLEA